MNNLSLAMTAITNPKIIGMAPHWAPFAGFSVLFDNPGNAMRVVDGTEMLHCMAESGGPLDLYGCLDTALREVVHEALVSGLCFCPLPPSSYHVTVWDGINAENLALVPSRLQQEWAAFLQTLPVSLNAPPVSLDCVLRSVLLTRPLGEIRFRFEALRVWGNQVLVAELAAADKSAAHHLHQCTDNRTQLSEASLQALGISASADYTPHVSLGYFANEDGGRLAQACLSQWNVQFQDRLAGTTIAFDSLAVYGFTDMAHFYRMKQQRGTRI